MADEETETDPDPSPGSSRPRRSGRTPRERRRDRRRGTGAAKNRTIGLRAAPSSRGVRRSSRRAEPAPKRVRRRSRTLRRVGIAIVVIVVAVGAVTVAVSTGLVDRAVELVAPDVPVSAEAEPVGDRQPSLVIVTHDEDDPSGQARGVMVLAYDRETGQGSIVLVPTAILTDVPGYGTFQLREAFALGDAPLVDISLANLLGVEFDGAASVSAGGWSTWLDRTGGYAVTVRSPLTDPDGDMTRFEAGAQVLDGDRLAEYLTFRGDGESELETLPRVQDVLLGLLDRLAEDPELLDAMFADGAPMVETTEAQLLRTLLGQLSSAQAEGRVTTLTLPVTPLGSGREDSYRLDAARATTLVDDRLAASRPTEGAGVGRGVQILNGSGAEAIGRQVAERLSGGGYRVVLTGNADSFDYEATLIVVYDDTSEQLAMAEDVRERLGVGEIQRSATPQSVVDVTIVVGADFPE